MLNKNNKNIVQTANVPSCVLLLAPKLRNSTQPKRKGTAREKLSILQSIAEKTKKEKTVQEEKRRRSGPAPTLLSVAKSPTQLTKVSMCITIVYCVFWTVYCVLCTVNCLLCAVNFVLCIVYCALCTVYCVLSTVNCVLCSVNCVLCIVYRVLCKV